MILLTLATLALFSETSHAAGDSCAPPDDETPISEFTSWILAAIGSQNLTSSGSITLTKVSPTKDKCDASVTIAIKQKFHFAPGSTTLDKAMKSFDDANLLNGLQAEYEKGDSRVVVRGTKTPSKSGYQLTTTSKVKFAGISLNTRNYFSTCKETKSEKSWEKICKIDLSAGDAGSTFNQCGPNELCGNVTNCTEGADGSVDCVYTQNSSMKAYCSFIKDVPAMEIGLNASSRTARMQLGIAEQIALGGDGSGETAYSAMKQTLPESKINSMVTTNTPIIGSKSSIKQDL